MIAAPSERQAMVSIHALLTECDQGGTRSPRGTRGFNPRTPYGVRQAKVDLLEQRLRVSIHALLTECDFWDMTDFLLAPGFNPRTPYGVRHAGPRSASSAAGFNPRTPYGVRRVATDWNAPSSPFQSTHSLRSATTMNADKTYKVRVSIHALLTECDWIPIPFSQYPHRVSIHALLTECDNMPLAALNKGMAFQSTHSLRSATSSGRVTPDLPNVSIHALLTECDSQ